MNTITVRAKDDYGYVANGRQFITISKGEMYKAQVAKDHCMVLNGLGIWERFSHDVYRGLFDEPITENDIALRNKADKFWFIHWIECGKMADQADTLYMREYLNDKARVLHHAEEASCGNL